MSKIKQIAGVLQKHFGKQAFESNITSVIGYGSGVMPQTSSQDQVAKNTVDLIVQVKSARDFHVNHLQKQPQDYTGLSRSFGWPYVSFLKQKVFPIHFNNIQIDSKLFKYSIVEQQCLQQDLREWNLLSLAGRLHKPVELVHSRKELTSEMSTSHVFALSIAIMMLARKQRVKITDLYYKICQISYLGDIRFALKVENPKKIENIVVNNIERFNLIYIPLIKKMQQKIPKSFALVSKSELNVVLCEQLCYYMLHKDNMPACLYQALLKSYEPHFKGSLSRQVLQAGVRDFPGQIQRQISLINRKSSIKMAAHAFLAGSPLRNAAYLMKKIVKRFK